MGNWWTVSPEWAGEVAFVIAGGPSVADQNLEPLRGRKVIVINSSYELFPWAQYLFYGDSRWWSRNKEKLAASEFKGRIVSCTELNRPPEQGPIMWLKKSRAPGLATEPNKVMMRRTSLSAATNLAVHLGANPIVWLGADGKRSQDGRSHHHAPHPWPVKPGCWNEQKVDLKGQVGQLRERGIDVINCSPGSAWADLWPVMMLDEFLAGEVRQAA